MKQFTTLLFLAATILLTNSCTSKNNSNNSLTNDSISSSVAETNGSPSTTMKTIYDFTVLDKKKNEVSLAQYKGQVILVVNTASRCGFTPQYEALEAMYERLHGRGLEILDFPCNQFGQQAPGTDEEITQFCQLNYGTKFPQFTKADVNGENEMPLYTWLKS